MSRRTACRLLALFVLCFMPAQVRADDTHDIRTAYVQLDAAYSRRDVSAVAAFLASGFHRVKWNAILTPAEFQAELKDSFDGTASVTAATNIQKLAVRGDTADALVSRHVDFTLPKPLPGLPPPYFTIKVTQEHWQRIQGQWRMTAMDDTPLVQTLCLFNARDQEIRSLYFSDRKTPFIGVQMSQVDAADRARTKQIIHQYGWPGYDLVGTEGDGDAWLLVQHSDNDKAFQKRCLPLIAAAVKHGQSNPKNYAYLTDRILCGEHKPQMYGTQFTFKQDTQGNFIPRPIADPAHVDQRRAAVGLEPLADYAVQVKQMYRSEAKP